MAEKPENVTKSAVSLFALFAQSQSLILLLLLSFSIFLLEILKISFSNKFGSYFIDRIFEFQIWRHFSAISRKIMP